MLQSWSWPPFDPDCCRCELVWFGEGLQVGRRLLGTWLPGGRRGRGRQETTARTSMYKSEKRGVQAARNRPSEDRKCRQRVELGIYGLNRWTVKC